MFWPGTAHTEVVLRHLISQVGGGGMGGVLENCLGWVII